MPFRLVHLIIIIHNNRILRLRYRLLNHSLPLQGNMLSLKDKSILFRVRLINPTFLLVAPNLHTHMDLLFLLIGPNVLKYMHLLEVRLTKAILLGILRAAIIFLQALHLKGIFRQTHSLLKLILPVEARFVKSIVLLLVNHRSKVIRLIRIRAI